MNYPSITEYFNEIIGGVSFGMENEKEWTLLQSINYWIAVCEERMSNRRIPNELDWYVSRFDKIDYEAVIERLKVRFFKLIDSITPNGGFLFRDRDSWSNYEHRYATKRYEWNVNPQR